MKNLVKEIAADLPPFMLKNAKIEGVFVTDEMREEFVSKISATILFDSEINGMKIKFVELSTGDGVVWVNGDRTNLTENGVQQTKEELGL